MSETSPPSRAAATAWFAPLPPETVWNDWPMTVSPERGMRETRNTRSMLELPTTKTFLASMMPFLPPVAPCGPRQAAPSLP